MRKSFLLLLIALPSLLFARIDNERFHALYFLDGEMEGGSPVNNPTPRQPKGPFYPHEFPDDTDADLTILDGAEEMAEGKVIYLQGHVLDVYGNPLENARVEIWQAAKSGKYNHPNDPNTAPLDPHFQYYGDVKTNEHGFYMFKTIVPGAYPASQNWWRPPHIHFLVQHEGHRSVITQLYFKDHLLNEEDLILRRLSPENQEALTVDFPEVTLETGETINLGTFNIILGASN